MGCILQGPVGDKDLQYETLFKYNWAQNLEMLVWKQMKKY